MSLCMRLQYSYLQSNKEKEFELVGHYIATALKNPEDKNIINELKNNVLELLIKFPYNV